MNRLVLSPFAILLALALGAAPDAPAHAAEKKDKKAKKLDLVYTHPEFVSFGVQSIALLPPVTFDGSLEAEKTVGTTWGQQFRETRYRWVAPTTSRALMTAGDDGDALWKGVREQVLKGARVDSLSAPALCKKLNTDAVLSLQVERWEQLVLEWNQSGKPTTTVGIKAALVDAQGRLLWSASGSHTAEGPYQDANANVLGVKSSGLGQQGITGQGGPPSYAETLAILLTRWQPQFPSKPDVTGVGN
jgi:hypothetical protein